MRVRYAGKYLPAIAHAIIEKRLHLPTAGAMQLPLRGVAIGNGLTRPREMTLSVPDSYFAVGLLDGAQRCRWGGGRSPRLCKLCHLCVCVCFHEADEHHGPACTGAQRDHAAALAADCVAKIDSQQWAAATAARSVLFDYMANANGNDTAPNVDNFQ